MDLSLRMAVFSTDGAPSLLATEFLHGRRIVSGDGGSCFREMLRLSRRGSFFHDNAPSPWTAVCLRRRRSVVPEKNWCLRRCTIVAGEKPPSGTTEQFQEP
jgi:hypothetical protein